MVQCDAAMIQDEETWDRIQSMRRNFYFLIIIFI